MHTAQLDVQEFHQALDIPVGNYTEPSISRPDLRADLILEEACETAEAILGKRISLEILDEIEKPVPDLVKAIDGMCDILVVTYGTAVEFGVDLQPYWNEVHRTNMAKKGGPVRDDGKRLKPPGWKDPDVKGILERSTK
jgi:predicted HAD superfamily Cof-like phosphohydrolase